MKPVFPFGRNAGPLVIPDGTLEALKWFALILMTIDHVNTYVLDVKVPGMFAAGRMAMPLFAFVMACNLARPGALEKGLYRRTILRLAAVAMLATPIYIGFTGPVWRWWPLNIMFTLLAGACISGLLEHGGKGARAAAAVVFAAAGAVVDYLWFGLALYVASWLVCRQRSPARLLLWMAAGIALSWVNRNGWALLSLALILALQNVELKVPRIRYAFYLYYPAHLAVLLAIDAWMTPRF